MLLLLGTLAMLQPAMPKEGASWFSYKDYPVAAMRSNASGYVGFAVLVDPDGKPEKCEVTAPAAHQDLNTLTCALVMRRARFTPASDAKGRPAYGVFRHWASWFVADDPVAMERLRKLNPPPSRIDLTLFVNAVVVPAPIDLALSVDASGAIDGCESKLGASSAKLVDVACAHVRSQWKPLAGNTGSGQAVATVQSVRVGFEAQKASPPEL